MQRYYNNVNYLYKIISRITCFILLLFIIMYIIELTTYTFSNKQIVNITVWYLFIIIAISYLAYVIYIGYHHKILRSLFKYKQINIASNIIEIYYEKVSTFNSLVDFLDYNSINIIESFLGEVQPVVLVTFNNDLFIDIKNISSLNITYKTSIYLNKYDVTLDILPRENEVRIISRDIINPINIIVDLTR